MKLYCPECGQRIAANDINLANSSAVCTACNSVFGFTPLLEADRARQASSPTLAPANQRPLVPRPPRMHVQDWAGLLTIRWRWFQLSVIPMTLFCIAWDSFLIFWYKQAFANHLLIMIIFPIAHVGVGVGLTYSVLCGYLNSTIVRANSNTLQIHHGPLPWPGRQVTRSQICSLYCESGAGRNSGNTWDLCAVLANGQKLKLITRFTDPSEPKFLQHELEDRLQLTSQPVVTQV